MILKKKAFEIRKHTDGSLDEVVARKPAFFHLEQMESKHWWLSVDMPDGSRVTVNLWSDRKINARAEVE